MRTHPLHRRISARAAKRIVLGICLVNACALTARHGVVSLSNGDGLFAVQDGEIWVIPGERGLWRALSDLPGALQSEPVSCDIDSYMRIDRVRGLRFYGQRETTFLSGYRISLWWSFACFAVMGVALFGWDSRRSQPWKPRVVLALVAAPLVLVLLHVTESVVAAMVLAPLAFLFFAVVHPTHCLRCTWFQRHDAVAAYLILVVQYYLIGAAIEAANARRRRMNPAACTGCGYLLYGNESGRCPECGIPVDRTVDFTDLRPPPPA